MKKLLIVESPAKIKTLKKILGSDWEIAASFGHVRDLPRKEIAIEPPDFKPKYVVIDRARKTVSKLKSLAAKVDEVYLGSDPDREGEAIAWHLSRVLRLKSFHRVSFNSITKAAVTEAINNPSTLDVNKVGAQEARRALDRLVGYMISPMVTRALQSESPLSAGRVQSVALRLVVEREREIAGFTPTDHYGIRATFEDDEGGSWHADWDHSGVAGAESEEESTNLWADRASAEELVSAVQANPGFTVLSVEQKPQKRRPPAPFTTSTMQQAASAKLHMSPERTMELAQKLYEAGIITYHRTDNSNLSDEGVEAVRQWVIDRTGNEELLAEKPNKWKNKDGSQEGHEATRPTDFYRTKLTEEEEKTHGEEGAALYQMIWQRAVACQMRDALYDSTKAILQSDATLNGEQQQFVAKGRVLVDEGWMKLTKMDATDESEEEEIEEDQGLPELDQGLYIEADGVALQEKKTKPPARYTEASLVKRLEKEGVGRPSTYAATLKNIRGRDYIKLKSRKISATELGEKIIDYLVGNFRFAELDFTRNVESVLDRVAAGEFGYQPVVGKYHERLSSELEQMPAPPPRPEEQDSDYDCPKCGAPLRRRKSKKNKRHFWGCSAYPDCDAIFPDTTDQFDEPAPDFEAANRPKPQVTDVDCPKCGKGKLVRRDGRNGPFYGCNKYPKCKATYEEQDGAPLIEEEETAE